MGGRTDFTEYKNMPVKGPKGKLNKWYSDVIVKEIKPQIDKKGVVLLNKKNAEIIENAIEDNESYSAHFLEKLFEYHKHENGGSFPKENKPALIDLIRMIDLENSTNIWRYRSKRESINDMVNYICDKRNNFWKRLEKNDPKLVDSLLQYSKINLDSNGDGPKSLASKVCRYFCKLFYPKSKGYYVNDSVVRHVLPYYLKRYGLCKKTKLSVSGIEKMKYKDLHRKLESLRRYSNSKYGDNLTREEIDHIMWYSYRYQEIE